MREHAVVGITSNPTIFQKAIAEGNAYDDQLREVLAEEDDAKEVFLKLAVKDVQDACDLLREVWDGGHGQDGYVSIEVDPNLASDTQATTDEAQRLHELVDRPNCFVKIPATEAGLGSIEEMIARGRNINVTLIFSLQRYSRGRRGLPARARAARRGRRRPVQGRVGRELLRLSRRHRGRPAARGGRRARGAAGQARDREREARLRALQGAPLRLSAGRRSRRRARGSSAASGPRRRPRTPTTATWSTSRS